jgi:hypothetical protein
VSGGCDEDASDLETCVVKGGEKIVPERFVEFLLTVKKGDVSRWVGRRSPLGSRWHGS